MGRSLRGERMASCCFPQIRNPVPRTTVPGNVLQLFEPKGVETVLSKMYLQVPLLSKAVSEESRVLVSLPVSSVADCRSLGAHLPRAPLAFSHRRNQRSLGPPVGCCLQPWCNSLRASLRARYGASALRAREATC